MAPFPCEDSDDEAPKGLVDEEDDDDEPVVNKNALGGEEVKE